MRPVEKEGWGKEFPQTPIFFPSVEAGRWHRPGEFILPALLERDDA
jgi:hypothetical protein